MKKYMGLVVLVALTCTSLLAVKAAPDGTQPVGRKGAGANDSQISQLDKRLNERIVDQQALLAMVEKLLGQSPAQQSTPGAAVENVLSGQARPPAPPPPVVQHTVVARATVPPKPAQPQPWWQAYKPQMVYLSGSDRYAVVNGKMATIGQTLEKDVSVERIEDDAVVLRLGLEHHTYLLKK
jgi:hypothetical protein